MSNILNFNATKVSGLRLKKAPERYLDSDVRPNIEVSEGDRPFNAFEPIKYLPVKYQDRSTDEHVVLPLGRILSAATVGNSVVNTPNESAWIGDDSAIQWPSNSAMTYMNVYGLLYPANGGVAQTVTYTEDDALAGVPSPNNDGQAVVAGETYNLGANMPIGITPLDIYQDIRGHYINYNFFAKYGLLTDRLITLPFVNVKRLYEEADVDTEFVNTEAGDPYAVDAAGAAYKAAEKRQTFLYFNASKTTTDGSTSHKGTVTEFVVDTEDDGSGKVTGHFDVDGATAAIDADVVKIGTDYYPVLAVADADDLTVKDGITLDVSEKTELTGTETVANIWPAAECYTFAEKGGLSGQLLKADWNGCFIPEADDSLESPRTAQTVGRLFLLDSVTNKDMLDSVQTRFEQMVTGSGTAGVEKNLYSFAMSILSNSGYTFPADKDAAVVVRELVEAGVFGRSFIQLNIR